jgi:hypothetical protein
VRGAAAVPDRPTGRDGQRPGDRLPAEQSAPVASGRARPNGRLVGRADAAIQVIAGVTVVALAGIAGAISYSHMTALADTHGEHGWRAHAFPLSVDGVEVVASLVLLADRRAGRRSGWLPWAALAAGTAASLAANVAVGGTDLVGRAVAGWPALALLIAVKLLSGLLDHRPSKSDDQTAVPESVIGGPAAPGTVPDAEDTDHATGNGDLDGRGTSRTVPDGAVDGGGGQPGTELPGVDVSALLPAARSAAITLAQGGQALTREGLARQLRADGHAASNARVSAVLKALVTDSCSNGNGRHGAGA